MPEIIWQRSDNCAAQYKSSYAFGEYQQMTINYGQKVLTYCGPSGHGKGLVDTMSAFGAKGPLYRASVIDKFSYNSYEMCD